MGRQNGRLEIAISVAMFVATIVFASVEHWSVTDLVWSLWVTSLLTGYSLIIVSIVGALLFGGTGSVMRAGNKLGTGAKEAPPGCPAIAFNGFILFACFQVFGLNKYTFWLIAFAVLSIALAIGGSIKGRVGGLFPPLDNPFVRVLLGLPMAVFMLGFFTIHFLGFHLVHGIFLNGFFPLVKNATPPTSQMDDFARVAVVAREALARYWPFVAASALSRAGLYNEAFKTHDMSMIAKPYVNVIRMHIMIFVFAFVGRTGLQSWGLYALLIMYFLPFGALLSLFGVRRKGAPAQVPQDHKPAATLSDPSQGGG